MNIVNRKPLLLLLLWRSRGLRTFHLRNYYRHLAVNNISTRAIAPDHGWSSCSTPTIIASNINRRHRLALVRLLLTYYKDHSQQRHFCTSNTNIKLPDQIEQQCEQWAQVLCAEWEAGNAKHTWMGRQLKCTDVLPGLKTSRLLLSTENFTPEKLRILRHFYPLGESVEIKLHLPQRQSNSIDPLDNVKLLGIVRKHLPRGDILIYVNRYFNLQQRQLLQQCSFAIRKIENPKLLENRLNFLGKRHSEWHKLPGSIPLLQAFKCQPLPEDTGLDPVDWIGSHGKDLDPSQCRALSAALNLKRPIVAVHGPPGSGKTRILAEYLHALSEQGKKVLVVSSSVAGLYHLLGKFCKKFPIAASSNANFLCFKRFDAQMTSKVIANETIERLIEKNSFSKLQKNDDEKTRKNYELTSTLKSAMEKRPDLREEDLMREAEEVSVQMREISHQMSDEATKKLLLGTSILFSNVSNPTLNMFARLGLTFDVVITDDAVKFSEFASWMMTLPTAPILRLFGDYNQPGIPLISSIGRELNFDKSLLQRLDEQFGPELNFHLRRQYRSNAAIQAWPNRAFYGQRAAESDESVRNIRLDDLMEEGKSVPPELITDPLVLIDLSQLEGDWRDWMFKAEKGGNSWQNWGEAFLTASHLWHLFEHLPQICPSKICYLTHHDAQRIEIWRVFSALFKHHLQKFDQIRMERSANLQGQQFDVVIEDCVTVPPPEAMVDPFHLKRLNYEICRARRQFIWFANSKWLEEGSEQSRQLLQTFRQYGRIIGPNQLLPLERGQFREMTKKVEDSYQKMRDRRNDGKY